MSHDTTKRFQGFKVSRLQGKQVLLLCFLSFVICTNVKADPQPLWPSFGLEINDAIGNTSQQKPQIINAGDSSYLVVWEDGRAGYDDLYLQKLGASGQPLWQKDGVVVCDQSGNQNFAQLISDNAGGAIVVWQDYRNGNADILAQRFDQSGNALWANGGVYVCSASAGQFNPQITSDGQGGAIITWHDYRNAIGEDIYAQRLNSDGQILWEKDGVSIVSVAGTQWYPKIASDNAGGAIIVWSDSRTSSSDKNIFAQRINSQGISLWQKDGLPVCSTANNQESPNLIVADDQIIIAWNDARSGNNDVYAQKLDLNGSVQWAADGVALCSFPYPQENPAIASDGNGGAIAVWTDSRTEKANLYAQRISDSGNILWAENGIPVAASLNQQGAPLIKKASPDDWLIVWEEDHPWRQKKDLLGQKINSAGTRLWGSGQPIVEANQNQESPSLTASASGELVVVWQDKRFGNTDLYAQKINLNGNRLWGKDGQLVCNAQGSVFQQKITPCFNNKGRVLLAFEDGRFGFSNIYLQQITPLGQLVWGPAGLAVAKVEADQIDPCLVADSKGGTIIAWTDFRQVGYPLIRAQRITAQGKNAWTSSLPVAPSTASQEKPQIISDSAGGAIIAWQDERDVLSQIDLYAQRISEQGKLLWGPKGKIIISENGQQVDFAMIPDNNNGAFFIWTDYRLGDRNPDIYAQRINSKGDPLWAKDGVIVCGAPDIQRLPRLVADGSGGIIVSWTDKGGGSYDIYAQRLDSRGQFIWAKDGIAINQLSRTQQNSFFGNKKILVWEDYRLGNWDLYAAAVSSAGKLLWGEDGVPIVTATQTQYAPQLAPLNDGSVIVAWEDYRCGKYYELYFQKINLQGEVSWTENGRKNKSRDGGRAPRVLAPNSDHTFYLFWEDYTNGGRAIYGQRYLIN
ncbi:hypothetical protein COT42_02390 [Candidatus Saganbacteria bacterium CG08_land_8_20_14_0_20_45_16]|uniref:Bulb-type lectin domain-containing protein n=1 Tax=Candidatus Saganbacteria bacterium CG08_land_8_20_14_0_20_45_16 TaxID=2014293 RepID=A0A2H0Y091_UNCSA|nr:MAG: hypothetical protein COT42_02390 [Candidatus Saganbacteria bacterium CG08_land_8_20_14_0_20_45_16]